MQPKQFSVLAVDDSENDCLLLQRAFSTLEHLDLTHCVKDGSEALAYLSGSGEYADRDKYPFPDLMMLDIKMPVMNGFELLKWMKHQCWGKKPVVVLLTSSAMSEDINEGSELGADLYRIKPVTRDGLAKMMREIEKFVLQVRGGSPAAQNV